MSGAAWQKITVTRDNSDGWATVSFGTFDSDGKARVNLGGINVAYAGMYYYRARWYDQRNGRFLSEDPKGFKAGDTNLYRYVTESKASASGMPRCE